MDFMRPLGEKHGQGLVKTDVAVDHWRMKQGHSQMIFLFILQAEMLGDHVCILSRGVLQCRGLG